MVLLLRARSFWFLVDDAFIAFRYAENLADGRGLVFNVGERVEGYTDFLWVVLLAVLHGLGLDIPTAAQWLGAACGLAVLPATWWAGRRVFALSPFLALLPCAVLAASAPLAIWMGAGLETPLFATLMTLALARTTLDLGGEGGKVPLGGFVFGLAALTRPEAIGLFGVVCAASLLTRPRHLRALLWTVGGFVVLVGPHLAFRWGYYGHLLPNTFYAKVSPHELPVGDGLRYVGEFLLTTGAAWGALAGAGLWLSPAREQSRRALLPVVALAAAFGYVALVGGDFYPFSRFCIPYLPWLVLLCCVGARNLGERIGARAPAFAVGLVATSLLVPGAVWPEQRHPTAVSDYRRSARMFETYGRSLSATLPPGTLVATSSLGAIGYYSGLPMLDMLGLVDEHVARSTKSGVGRAAHRKYDSDYVLARAPDLVTMEFAKQADQLLPDDVTTELVSETVMGVPNWPAVTDLLARSDFRARYTPEAVELEPGVFIFQFRRDERLAQLQQRMAEGPPELGLLFELGAQYRKQGLYSEALEIMQEAAELAPTIAEPQINIGFYFLESRRFGLAKYQFNRLQAALPSDPRILFGLAMTAHRMGQYAEAKQRWEGLLDVEPAGPNAATARALLREATSRVAQPQQ